LVSGYLLDHNGGWFFKDVTGGAYSEVSFGFRFFYNDALRL
jgi:hypothetical protein